jgi:hypothetical protein
MAFGVEDKKEGRAGWTSRRWFPTGGIQTYRGVIGSVRRCELCRLVRFSIVAF